MSDLKPVWQWLARFGTEDDKKRFRPVYQYIQKLEAKIKKLEAIVDEQMAPQFFEKKTKLQTELEKEALIKRSIENSMKLKNESFNGESLKERLRQMILDNKTESSEWSRTLKWNKLSQKEAYEIAGLEG
jgi:hypothetical protein